MSKSKKETLAEKISNADIKIVSKKGQQDFIFLWQEQQEVIRELERVLDEKFGITGKPKAIGLACKYLLNDLEEKEDVKES